MEPKACKRCGLTLEKTETGESSFFERWHCEDCGNGHKSFTMWPDGNGGFREIRNQCCACGSPVYEV